MNHRKHTPWLAARSRSITVYRWRRFLCAHFWFEGAVFRWNVYLSENIYVCYLCHCVDPWIRLKSEVTGIAGACSFILSFVFPLIVVGSFNFKRNGHAICSSDRRESIVIKCFLFLQLSIYLIVLLLIFPTSLLLELRSVPLSRKFADGRGAGDRCIVQHYY